MDGNSDRICFLFPGQGAQKVGMLSGFFQEFECFRSIFEQTGEWTGIDIAKIVYEPNDLINQTRYTQLAILVVELGLLRVLNQAGVEPCVMAGYSLGEYSCLVKSGILTEESAVKLIVKRAEHMESACPAGMGGMAAVIGMDWEAIDGVIGSYDKVWIANYNSKQLVSISGEKTQVMRACEDLKAAGAKRVIPVNVSGPFHTPLLKEASDKLGVTLKEFAFSEPEIVYYANVSGEIVSNGDDVRSILARQVSSPVRWSHSMSGILKSGIGRFVEVGPGKVLRGFLRDEKDIALYGMESISEYEALLKDVGK